jgi:hypothetical protein
MSYGIYDKASHVLIEQNLPASTTYIMAEQMTAEAPESHEGYEIAVLFDTKWFSLSTHAELIVLEKRV